MKFQVITIGEVKKNFIKEGVLEYLKRLHGFAQVDHIVVKEDKKSYEKIMKLVEKTYLVVLDEHGREYTNAELAHFLDAKLQHGVSSISFVIGASDGHPDFFIKEADMVWSLSQLTLPHEQALLFLLETLYRSLSLNNNHPYHRG